MNDDVVIQLDKIWKVFGPNADEVMEIIQRHKLSKEEVLEQYSCVVGVSDCSFEVRRGEILRLFKILCQSKITALYDCPVCPQSESPIAIA